MKSIVISLKDNNEKRKKHIQYEFNKRGISFEYFDAITPNKINDLIIEYDIKISNLNLTQGEIACFLSHFSIWVEIVNNNINIASIFEDDIYLSSTAKEVLHSQELLGINFDIVKLEKSLEYISISISSDSLGNYSKIHNLKKEHLGAAGYIITKNAAQKLISYIKMNGLSQPVDILIFDLLLENPNFTIKQIVPAVCIQDFILNKTQNNFPSSLEEERAKNYVITKNHKSKSIFIRTLKEIIRPFKRVYRKIYLSFKHQIKFIQ